MAQTSIRQSRSGAFIGQLREEMAPKFLRTGIVAEGRTATPGQPVLIVGDAANGEDLVRDIEDGDTIDASTVAGFVRLDTFRENVAGSGYTEGKSVSVVREGVLYVEVSAAVSKGDPVFVGNATAQLGDVEGAAGTGLAKYPGAVFLRGGDADDIVPIYVRTEMP